MARSQLYRYREDLGLTPDRDLTGFTVHARDGEMGTIDFVSREAEDAFIVIDTSSWKTLGFGRHVVLPGGVLERVDGDARAVRVALTQEQIREAPELDPSWSPDVPLDPDYRDQLGGHYERDALPAYAADQQVAQRRIS